MSARSGGAAVLAIALVTSCQRRSAAPPPAPTASVPAAATVLDHMDTRVPVPLLPMMANHQKQNMRDHLEAVQAIAQAIAADDFPAVERASGRIGYSEAMGQMCQHMGAGAPGFTEQALKFHHTADTIGEAAHRRSRTGVLEALGATLQTCVACHAAFKQKVVDEAAWSALTSRPPPAGPGHAPSPHH